MLIAIDGPSGVGKSTVSRLVAGRLGLSYLDTGSTYRAATLAVVRAGVDPGNEDEVLAELAMRSIGYTDLGVTLDGAPVGIAIRTDHVTAHVSAVSAHPRVREAIVRMQRDWASTAEHNAVVEGRDIGTVVFPAAPWKFYLTATPLVRAHRRSQDAEASGQTVADIATAIEARDHADSTRQASPLRPAEDSIVIDTSELTVGQVVETILGKVQAGQQEAPA